MDTKRNNNLIWWILGGALVVLCCCCLFVFGVGGLAVGLLAAEQDDTPPALLETIPPEETAPAGPTATPKAEGQSVPTPRPSPTPVVSEFLTEQELLTVVVPPRDLRTLAEGLRKTGPIPEVVRTSPKPYRIGDQERFWISDQDSNEHRQIDATLVYSNSVLYIWVESGLRYNLRDLKASADRFAQETYPTNRNFFGSEWSPGVDGDPRLHILHSEQLGSRIAGYFSGADAVSRLAQPYSNEREMFYIHLGNAEPNTDFYDGVLAHEFQHMIHWYQDKNEDTWVNEGMSELAVELNGYSRGGADQVFSELPDTQLTTWNDDPNARTEHYGAAYLFMAYFLQRFGNTMTQALVSEDANSVEGFNKVLADHNTGLTFDDVFADWVIANFLDDPRLADGRYGYEKDDLQPMALDARHRRYPVQRETTVSQYATDYIELRGPGSLQITFQGDTVNRLAKHEAHSGRYAWWGNRVDDSDARLTRAFDLSGVDKATLEFWTWYHIEYDWDYGYAMVSADGGRTWTPLRTEDTVDTNPNGNSFGWAFTGCSGDPSATEAGDVCNARWIRQTADLTPFVGKEVLIRFEYITDDAVNYPGFFVDDISIPEIGYRYDAETDDGGWVSEGWLRTDNLLRQRWLVQLIQFGDGDPVVGRLPVDENGRGEWTVNNLGRNDRVVLAISALAPVTTEPASYQYTVVTRP
ncbi:MAG: immune inhibitor A [Caldilineales bacterium]|nr:immune inhibitor A [Caldilineales bacterium]MDW8318396.1 immune inhibitor A [Anaerolineae bacterium]